MWCGGLEAEVKEKQLFADNSEFGLATKDCFKPKVQIYATPRNAITPLSTVVLSRNPNSRVTLRSVDTQKQNMSHTNFLIEIAFLAKTHSRWHLNHHSS